jgi:butyrate kinase
MAKAITRLAVFEERQTHDRTEISRVIQEMSEHDRRIDQLELAQPLLRLTTDWVQKAVWLVVGAVIAAVLALVVMSRGPDVVSRSTTKTTTETQK